MKTRQKNQINIDSMKNIANHYLKKGNTEKYNHFSNLAEHNSKQLNICDTFPDAKNKNTNNLPEEIAEESIALFNSGHYDAILSISKKYHHISAISSMASSILLRRGQLNPETTCLGFIQEEERLLKLRTAELMQNVHKPLSVEPRVHMIILTHNRAAEIQTSFQELANTNYHNLAIYVADNGSNDNSFEIAREALSFFPAHVQTYIDRLPTNIGRPAGHNWLLTAHDHSKADYIAIGDDDLVKVPQNWLTQMIATAQAFPGCAAVGGKALNPGKPKVIHGGVRRILDFSPTNLKISNESQELDYGQHDYIDLTDHVIACLQIYERTKLEEAGLFDIRFSPCQLVDIEHHLRMRLMGQTIVYNGLIEFEHLRAMGRQAGKERATIGNSLGNIVKLLHKYDHVEVKQMITQGNLKRAHWLKTGEIS